MKKKNDRVYIEYLSVSPTRLTTFGRLEPKPVGVNAGLKQARPPEFKGNSGLLSKKAKSRMEKAISYMIAASDEKTIHWRGSSKKTRYKLSFVTLTLSSEQVHDDEVIKKELLDQFLLEVKRKYRVTVYFWRAEKQRNGNIHFHILVNRFIPWYAVRAIWNRIQNKLGYVDRYSNNQMLFFKDGFKFRPELAGNWSYKNQQKAYHEGMACGFTNPNSTDIHSIKKMKNVLGYVMKYCTKDPEELLVSGRAWGLSRTLSQVKNFVIERYGKIDDELDMIAKKFKKRLYTAEYFTTMKITMREVAKVFDGEIVHEFMLYLEKLKLAWA